VYRSKNKIKESEILPEIIILKEVSKNRTDEAEPS
jgi:hypothetical protein